VFAVSLVRVPLRHTEPFDIHQYISILVRGARASTMSQNGGPSSKGKGRAPPAEDVKAQRESVHNSRRDTESRDEADLDAEFRYETDSEYVGLDPFPSIVFESGNIRPIGSWSWIEGHCARRQDLIPKQRRILSEAISALVEKSDAIPLYLWSGGMKSVLRNVQRQLAPYGRRGRILQVLGVGQSQYRSLTAQQDEINRCQNVVLEVLSKWQPNPEPGDWHSRQGQIMINLENTPSIAPEDGRVVGEWKNDDVLAYVKDQLNEQGSDEVGYIVIALRSRASNDPRERLIKIKHRAKFFKDLRKGINILRGWRGFFSLKSLKAFGLSKVS
jgi:hypothetical protein